MANARRVLIADPDLTAVRALTRALRAKGYQVQHAPDGSRALEQAVLRHPDVILFDESCTLIEAKSFVQILNTNPRTEDIPVVVTTASRDVDRLRIFREGVLTKPYNVDEVLSRIDHLCRRLEAARNLKGDAREIEGALSQLPLADLLQILAMNKRTGRLTLVHGEDKGEIHLSSGRPVNARLKDMEGEKALFRLVSWRQGNFAFLPGPPPLRSPVDRSMESALLEGMRIGDERARLLESLPPLSQALALSPAAAAPVDPHPVTAEVLRLLAAHPRRLADLLDLTEAPDLEVLGALSALLQRGVVELREGDVPGEGPLLGPAEVHALRGRMMRGKPARNALVAKVIVCGTGQKAGRFLLKALTALTSVPPDSACLRSSFGTLGRLDVSDALKVDLLLLPTADAARPLWRPFVTGALGALVLEQTEPVLRLARYCAFDLRLPLVIASGVASNHMVEGELVPPSLRGAPAGAAVVSLDLASAVRTLLVSAMQTPAPETNETVLLMKQRILGTA